jgi:hypothetical protein
MIPRAAAAAAAAAAACAHARVPVSGKKLRRDVQQLQFLLLLLLLRLLLVLSRAFAASHGQRIQPRKQSVALGRGATAAEVVDSHATGSQASDLVLHECCNSRGA